MYSDKKLEDSDDVDSENEQKDSDDEIIKKKSHNKNKKNASNNRSAKDKSSKKHKNTTCRTTQTRPCEPTHPSRSATPPWRTLRTLTRRRATLIEIQRLVESLLCLYDAQPLKTKVETNLNKPRFGQC